MSIDQTITIGASILVVDDTHDNLRFLTKILSEHGYKVRPVSDGSLALSSAQTEVPDLILLDIKLPGMSGYEICEKLKADERTRDIPVIFISALHESLDKVRAFFVGGVDYITKPFQDEEILARVETHLTLRNIQKHLQQKNTLLQREIDEHKQVEKSLKESEERYRRLVKLSPEAIVVHQTGKIVYVNDAGAKLFAFPDPEELIGKQLMDVVHPSSHNAAEKWTKKTYKEGIPTTLIEEQVIRLDGQRIYVEVSGASIIYQGTPSTQLVIRDTTERNRMEDLLRKLQKAVETTEVGVTISSSEGRIVYVNPAEAVMHGYTVDELIGQPSNIFATPEFRKDKAITKQEFEKLSNWKRERVNVRKDGSVFPVRLISNPIYDEKEKLVGRVTICEDITKRKQAEQSLKKSEKRYRSIFKNATIGIFQVTPEGRFLTANPALARMLGYSSAQDIIKTVTNIAEQVYVEPHNWHEITDIARMIQEGVRVETRCRDKDGREITVYLNLWAVRDERDEVHYFEGFIEDITEQKQMEEALAKERNLLHTLIDSSPELIYVKDIESRFLLANKAVLRSMGLTSLDELVGKTDFDFHPKYLAEQYYEAERPVIESGQPMINRQEIIIDQGTGASKWLLSSKVPFRDGQNNIAGLVGLNRDITELKQTERTLREQTILLGGVAEAMRRLLVSTEFETSIIEALEVLGFVTGVDRIYIFETHHHPETKEPLMSQRFIWEQELSEVQIDNSERQNIPYGQGLERWYERLSSNKIVSGLVRNFPPSERVILESRGILSILVTPITVEQHFWGFIAFDDCQDEREWSKEDKSILFAMAGSIGGAIARHQA